MSADGNGTACPGDSAVSNIQQRLPGIQADSAEENVENTKKLRKVSFPNEEALVTQYFEPANPWQDVPTTSRAQLAAEYLEACRIHNTPPIDAVLQQIRELPDSSIGGSSRAPRLLLSECSLLGNAGADALEALLSKVQFRRVELHHARLDDEGAEAIFDMLEYYESAAAVCIVGPRHFGIRGWQAASRMIKKSAELLELEISDSPLDPGHASVLARSLRPLACRLRSLCLQRAQLSGDSLLSLVIALKSNSSVRELRLGDNGLTAHDASQLGSLLRYNTRIQLLDLSNNQIQDAGVAFIADALVNQAAQTPPSAAASPLSPHHLPLGGYDARGLAFLVLWNNQLTWNCAQHLAKVLRSSPSLCVLNVGRNALGAETVRALSSGPGIIGGALVSLGLQAARLAHDAAAALADLVRADTRLQRLDLRDNKLGVEGLQAICSAMKENTTLTQIDLDEPTDSATSLSASARIIREIRALCRRNEPAAPAAPDRLLRKISLTCHTATLAKAGPTAEEERRTRLRSPAPSPAPSPAGSPVPTQHPHPHHSHSQSRFYVTRVTPERESSTDSSCSSPSTPTRPAGSPSPSRFKVVQVAEPPKIQVHPASQPRKASSRFSVTRNYDSMYNPTPPPAPTRPDSAMSDPGVPGAKADDDLASTPDSVKSDSEITIPKFTTQIGSNPINVARFIVSRPDFDPLRNKAEAKPIPQTNTPQKVSNSRFTVSKPELNSVVDRVKEREVKGTEKLCGGNPYDVIVAAKPESSVVPIDRVIEPEKESESKVGGDVIVAARTESDRLGTQALSKDDKTEVNKEANDSNKAPASESRSVVGKTHRVFHVQPVTNPPRPDTDRIENKAIINVPLVVDETKIEAPSIEGGKDEAKTAETDLETSKAIPDAAKITDTETSKPDITGLQSSIVKIDTVPIESIQAKTTGIVDLARTEVQIPGNSSLETNKDKIPDIAPSLKDTQANVPEEPTQKASEINVTKDSKIAKDIISPTKDDTKKLEVIQEVILSQDSETNVDEKVIVNDDACEKLEIIEELPIAVVKKEHDREENSKIKVQKSDISDKCCESDKCTLEMQKDEIKIDAKTSIDDKTKAADRSEPVPDVKTSDSVTPNEDVLLVVKSDKSVASNNKSGDSDGKTGKSVTNVHCDSGPVETDTGKTVELKDRVNINDKNVTDHTMCDSNIFNDKTEELSHNETVSRVGDDTVLKTETKLVKNSVGVSETEIVDVNVEVTVNRETLCDDAAKVRSDQNVDTVYIDSGDKIDSGVKIDRLSDRVDKVCVESDKPKKDGTAIKQIEAITQDLGSLIQEMQDLSCKTRAVRTDATQTDECIDTYRVPVSVTRESVLKKNKSESSLDSPDLEVSRLMKRKPDSAFRDSSSSLEISGSSMESLNAEVRKPITIPEVESELDRRRESYTASAESSIESASDVTPVNLLNLSVSSNESVSPIIFGGKKLHGSLSSLEASVSSLESRHEKVMVTSADSGIEYSLQNPSENKEDASSNEGTLTHNSSLKETVKKDGQETLTSPKRTNSLLDVPAMKTKGLDRMRKISWVAPSASFHVPKPEPDRMELKLQSNLEKLLSLFQHPSSLFSRSQSEDEKKSASNTPPRKDSSLTSSFWSWGSSTDKSERDDKEDRDSLSEATDSTLSERVQHSFVDESFSKKLDSKTPSTDTDNTLSEFQSFQNEEKETGERDSIVKVTDLTTDDNLVQKSLVLSVKSETDEAPCDNNDLIMPNDLNKVYEDPCGDTSVLEVKLDEKAPEFVRPRTFAAVLKAGTENLQEKPSPEGHPIDKLPNKMIRGIKENISPENTISINIELEKNQIVLENEPKPESNKAQSDLAPIATMEETCDEAADNCIQLAFIDDVKIVDDERVIQPEFEKVDKSLDSVDLGKDALSYLIYESRDFAPDTERGPKVKTPPESLAQELKDAEIKEELLDLSPELVLDEALEMPEVFTMELKGMITSIPERAKKKSNSLEDLSKREETEKDSPKTKTIAFTVPESTPRDIPERRTKLRSRSGSSPKSLPESLNKPSPLAKMDTILSKKKKKVSSLGKIARDSLLALNMSEEEIAEFRRSYKLTSVESLKSLESVSEDANSQSGTSYDSRCRACLRLSQESLMSLDSITEDCRCLDDCDKRAGQSNR